MNNAKKRRKAIEWEKTDMFQKVGDIYQGNISYKDGYYKGQKGHGLNRSRRDWKEEVARIHRGIQ